MRLITLDFETYYDSKAGYTLSKMTTEEYIRDSRFEVIGVGVKVDEGETQWASGTHQQLKAYLQTFDWSSCGLLAHNTLFDAAILSWIFDVHPKVLLDTLSMARAIHGINVGGSLSKLVTHYGLGKKGTEVITANGLRRADFTAEALGQYGDYCINDVELTFALFKEMRKGFPMGELKLIDHTLRMFTEPVLELDVPLLEAHLAEVQARKETLLAQAGVAREDLMSNDKFAALLRERGVTPPTKISARTNKETYAFAKTDDGFKALLEHPDQDVQILANARLGNKSTLEETRTQRFIDIGTRGALPVPIKYYAAHTGRWGGLDKINLQNLPSRGPQGKTLKRAIMAPEGHVIIDADSSQIEARVLVWLAQQQDILDAFARGEDTYKLMASRIYSKPDTQIDSTERFVGKSAILGCGYGMGAPRFKDQLASMGFELGLDECRRIIHVYRHSNDRVVQFWRECEHVLHSMVNGRSLAFGVDGLLTVIGLVRGIKLPSGLLLRYPDLQADADGLTYKSRYGRTKIYGGKVTENVCQAVARCIIGEQMVAIAKRYRAVMTVHDSIAVVVPEHEAGEARQYIEGCMRTPPEWASTLPLDCESGVARRYGDC